MYVPLNYDQINTITGTYNPSTFIVNSQAFRYWQRALYHRVLSVIKFDFNDKWKTTTRDYILYVLFRNGYIGVGEVNDYGLFAQHCTLKGMGFYYQPTSFIVTNPQLKDSKEFIIGDTGELLRLTPDYLGIFDIINYHAEQLASLKGSIDISIENSKIPYILAGKNKSAVAALKKIVDQIHKGVTAIFYNSRISDDQASKSEPFQHLELFNKEKYITDLLLRDCATILHNFDTEIGIPTIPYEKKERMVTSEAESKQAETFSRVSTWVTCLNESFDLINKMFSVNMSATLNFDGIGGVSDVEQQTNTDGNVSL